MLLKLGKTNLCQNFYFNLIKRTGFKIEEKIVATFKYLKKLSVCYLKIIGISRNKKFNT